MKKLTKQTLMVVAMALAMPGVASADNDADGGWKKCTLATLDGLYVFSATGYIIVPGAAPQPKAIVEFIRFNGDGTASLLDSSGSSCVWPGYGIDNLKYNERLGVAQGPSLMRSGQPAGAACPSTHAREATSCRVPLPLPRKRCRRNPPPPQQWCPTRTAWPYSEPARP